MNTPFNKIVQWQLDTGQLDHWTSYHIAAGIFIGESMEVKRNGLTTLQPTLL